jgi:hypothetical protein
MTLFWYTMGSQKVPEIMVLHCNGRTYDSAYLITFNIGPCVHTYLLHRSCRSWKHQRKASFGIFLSSTLAFDSMTSTVAKRVPLGPISRVGNSQKSLGARSGEYGGWVMTGTAAQQAMCGSVRYCDAVTIVPAWHLSRRFLRTATRNLCRTCT